MFQIIFNCLYYLVSFVLTIFFLMVGLIGIILPWSPTIRTGLVELILQDSLAISLFGFAFLIIGLGFSVSLYLNAKRKNYYLKLNDTYIVVNEAIIRHYLHDYFSQRFPNHSIPSRFVIKSNKIKIAADLPFVPKEEQPLMVSTIRQDLYEIFNKVLGYPHQCILNLSFPKNR